MSYKAFLAILFPRLEAPLLAVKHMQLITLDSPKQVGSFTVTNVTACVGGECFLFVNDKVSFILDSGFGFCAPGLYNNIKKELKNRKLDYILLTHSHFDHCLASGYITSQYPDCKVIAGEYAAKIVAKDGARATMRRLDEAAALSAGWEPMKEDLTTLLHVDIPVADGDCLDLAGTKAMVVSLPGHTKCSVSYFFPEEKIFFGCETLGIFCDCDKIMPSFLVGYQMSLDSIEKAAKYSDLIDYYFIPHQGYLSSADSKEFFDLSYKSHIFGKDLILRAYKEGRSTEEIIKAFEEVYYTELARKTYPYSSFLENANIQIPLIIRECGE